VEGFELKNVPTERGAEVVVACSFLPMFYPEFRILAPKIILLQTVIDWGQCDPAFSNFLYGIIYFAPLHHFFGGRVPQNKNLVLVHRPEFECKGMTHTIGI